MTTMTITRRNRIKIVMTYSPNIDLDNVTWQSLTPKQIMREFQSMRSANTNAFIFVHMRRNGKTIRDFVWSELYPLANGYIDEAELEIVES